MKTRALIFLSVLALLTAMPSVAQSNDAQSNAANPAVRSGGDPPARPSATQQTPASTRDSLPDPAVTQAPASVPSAAQQPPAQPASVQPSATPASATPSSAAQDDQDQKPVKEPQPKHDGSKKDVDAIGNRKVGGLDWYSTENEIRMGKGYAMELEKSTRLINDPVVTEYINRVGQNLVKNSDAKVPFTIKVIDSDEVNAMALPGGFFYVNSGLILAADEEAELAGVMAHEIAHVAAHHAAREQTRANYAQTRHHSADVCRRLASDTACTKRCPFGVPMTFLHFSREFESQADYLGVAVHVPRRIRSAGVHLFFEKIQNSREAETWAGGKGILDTHPQTPDRIAHTQEEINKILPTKEEYVVTTSEFDDVKARLARIENKRKLNDKKGAAAPTLRRASTSPNSTSSTDPSQQGGDDAPTLQRRDN